MNNQPSGIWLIEWIVLLSITALFLYMSNYIWRPLWIKSKGSCLLTWLNMKYESKMSWLVYYQVCGMITYSISHCSVHSMTHKYTFSLTGQKSLRIFSINIIIKLMGAWNNRFMSGDIIDISESLLSPGCPNDDSPVYWVYDDSQIRTQKHDMWLWGKNPHKPKAGNIVCCYGDDLHDLLKYFTKCHLSYCSRDLSKYTGHYQTDQL